LIIFGLSLSGPVFIINFCSALTIASSIEEDRGPASAMLGLLASSGVLYISILIAYVFDLDFFNFVCVVSGLQIVVIFIVIFVEYLERNKE
jgi:L-asparagine transporter-like permease